MCRVRVRDWYDQLETGHCPVPHGGTARALMVSLGLETAGERRGTLYRAGRRLRVATAGWRV